MVIKSRSYSRVSRSWTISRVEQAEEAAAEAEAQRRAGLHLEAEARIVEAELGDAFAQLLEIGGIDREEAAEDDGLHFLEAGEGFGGGAADVGDGVADAGLADILDLRGDEADFAGGERVELFDLGAEDADAVDQVGGARGHETDLLALPDRAVDHPDQDDDAEIRIVPAVDEHRLQGRIDVPARRRDPRDDRLQHVRDPDPGLRRGQHRVVRGQADDILDLALHLLGVGRGQIDLVDHRHDLMVVLDRLVDVGERLRFHALGRIDHQQRALAGGEAAADLIGEIDMARRVHQVEHIILPVRRPVIEPDRLRLDGNPALLLELHIVEHLPVRHLPRGQPAGLLDQPIGQRRFAVVDMGYNAEIRSFLSSVIFWVRKSSRALAEGPNGKATGAIGIRPPPATGSVADSTRGRTKVSRLPPALLIVEQIHRAPHDLDLARVRRRTRGRSASALTTLPAIPDLRALACGNLPYLSHGPPHLLQEKVLRRSTESATHCGHSR